MSVVVQSTTGRFAASVKSSAPGPLYCAVDWTGGDGIPPLCKWSATPPKVFVPAGAPHAIEATASAAHASPSLATDITRGTTTNRPLPGAGMTTSPGPLLVGS